jgi:hypothetical protein
MAIPQAHRDNFETMRKACFNGDLSLMECEDSNGNPVFVICMNNRYENGDVEFVPVAKMFDNDPYEEVFPPMECV